MAPQRHGPVELDVELVVRGSVPDVDVAAARACVAALGGTPPAGARRAAGAQGRRRPRLQAPLRRPRAGAVPRPHARGARARAVGGQGRRGRGPPAPAPDPAAHRGDRRDARRAARDRAGDARSGGRAPSAAGRPAEAARAAADRPRCTYAGPSRRCPRSRTCSTSTSSSTCSRTSAPARTSSSTGATTGEIALLFPPGSPLSDKGDIIAVQPSRYSEPLTLDAARAEMDLLERRFLYFVEHHGNGRGEVLYYGSTAITASCTRPGLATLDVDGRRIERVRRSGGPGSAAAPVRLLGRRLDQQLVAEPVVGLRTRPPVSQESWLSTSGFASMSTYA